MFLLYSFTVRCWIKLGHFPIPSVDDPKYRGFGIHYRLIWYSFLVVAYSCLPYLCALFVFKKLVKENNLRTPVLMYCAGCVLIAIQVVLDPFRIIYWYLD